MFHRRDMAGQLVLPFGVQPALKRETFITAPCNEAVFAFVQRWPDWPHRAAALYGPSGAGKTHLAAIWAEESKARHIAASEVTPDALAFSDPLVIEDLDREQANAARDHALLGLFDRPGQWLLLTGRASPSQWPVAVADLRSRFDSLISLPVWAPDDALLSALVRKHFADRQLEVSQAVVGRIITQVERTPEAVAGFVERADSKALAEKRAVTDRLIAELLDSEKAAFETG
jgi:chromosomal replication initiation ATPase DnaA